MLKRFFYIQIFFLALSITSCWDSWYDHHLIIGVDLNPATRNPHGVYIYHTENDTFTTNLIFVMSRDTRIMTEMLKGFSLIEECKATTRGIKWDNKLDPNSYSLFFDKYIILNHDTIQAGVNLLTDNLTKNRISIEYEENNSRGFNDIIEFDNSLLSELTFEAKTVKAYFTCKTNKNQMFTDSANFVIR